MSMFNVTEMSTQHHGNSLLIIYSFASQAIGPCVENQTEGKQIIGLHLANKLCNSVALLRSKGFKVKCPGHKGCTDTQNPILPLSEYEMGKEMGEDLRQQASYGQGFQNWYHR